MSNAEINKITKKVRNTYNLSDELFHEIRSRVNVVEEDIIKVVEIENITAETMSVEFDKIDELIENLNKFSVLFILDATNRPDAKTRAVIGKRIKIIAANARHIAFCTGNNILIRTAIKFAMYGSGASSISVSKTKEEALQNCINAKPRKAEY